MRIPVLIISAASLVALGGIAKADDHLFQAGPEGPVGALTEDSQPFQDNPTGFNPEDAPGQGSPFTGEHQTIPATDQGNAEHGQQLPGSAGPKN